MKFSHCTGLTPHAPYLLRTYPVNTFLGRRKSVGPWPRALISNFFLQLSLVVGSASQAKVKNCKDKKLSWGWSYGRQINGIPHTTSLYELSFSSSASYLFEFLFCSGPELRELLALLSSS